MLRVLLAGFALAAWAPAPQGTGPPPMFSARTEVVVLHVTVKDRRGWHIPRLPVEAFTVFEDDRPQPIAFFAAQDAPATVGLLLDSSGSMASAAPQVAVAAASFVDASHPQDQIFALTFNDRVWAALPPTQPFTADSPAMYGAIRASMRTYGRTALHDAVLEGVTYAERGKHERQVLVIVSDGGDNASNASFAEVERRILASNVAVYTVAFVDPVQRDVNPARLRQLAKSTGGESFESASMIEEIGDVFRRIASDIRHAYTIGYVPADPGRTGRLRKIRVAVKTADGRRLTVRTRSGYVQAEPR